MFGTGSEIRIWSLRDLSISLCPNASGICPIRHLLLLVWLGCEYCQPRVFVVTGNIIDDYPNRSPAYMKELNDNFMACCQAIPNFPTSCEVNKIQPLGCYTWCDYAYARVAFVDDAYNNFKPPLRQPTLFRGDFNDPEIMKAYFKCYSRGRDVTWGCEDTRVPSIPVSQCVSSLPLSAKAF
jgi:hypothetical protein